VFRSRRARSPHPIKRNEIKSLERDSAALSAIANPRSLEICSTQNHRLAELAKQIEGVLGLVEQN
jgi:hypothetical protein